VERSRYEVTFTLRVEDVLAFNGYHAAKQGRAGRSIFWWSYPVLCVLLGFLFLLSPGGWDGVAIILFSLAVLVPAVYYLLARLLLRAAIRRNARRDPTFPRKRGSSSPRKRWRAARR
jgi:hypothetical protein